MIGLLDLVEIGAPDLKRMRLPNLDLVQSVTRSESDPHARSGRLCMLSLVLIGLKSG